jgi:hypothetical protein
MAKLPTKFPKVERLAGFVKGQGGRYHRPVTPGSTPPPKPRDVGKGFTGFGSRGRGL